MPILTCTIDDVVKRLEAVEPLRLQAIATLLDVEQGFASGASTPLDAAAIDAAVSELRTHAQRVQKVSHRCQSLPPVPSKRSPTGF